MDFKLSNYHVASQPIATAGDGAQARFIYATRTGRSAKIDDRVYALLKERRFDELPTRLLGSLFALELLVPAGEDEFATVLERNKAAVATSTLLDAVIQPTANCQLGCSYCGQHHRKVKATGSLRDKIIARIGTNLAKRDYRTLSVQWFGAEPLMAYREILEISDRLIALCAERQVGYDAHMITNGLSLKPAIFLALSERRCTHFQITLDGTADTHDRLRKTKSGHRTFEHILNNVTNVTALPEFRERGCGILIRMNVNKVSAEEVTALIDLLAARGLHERGVSLDFQPVVNWGENKASKGSFTPEIYAEREIEWILYAMERGFRFGTFLPGRRTQPCMVVEEDGEVYDAEGNVYPCYEFPYTPSFETDAYRLGHLDSIDVERNDAALTRQWFTDIERNISPCPRCNLFPVCGGGCPKKWLHGERACPSFKDNIQDRLALHFLSKSGPRSEVVAA